MEGIFLVYNPQKNEKSSTVNVRAEDIAPTILSLFEIHDGLNNFDGRILREVIP
jgi:predicted AlkP superfamily phosphohydrolase/phosphomutase